MPNGPTGAAIAGALLCLVAARPAAAEVHFGSNVFVGGHDFSHQTFNRRHRGIVVLYDRPIRGEGCVVRADARGGTVKFCRLRRIRR